MLKPFGDFYQHKKVLVTGHTGFKGSWLALWLTELGAEVTGYSLEPDTDPNLFKALGLARKVKHHCGNILDAAALEKALSESRPDVVFHLAAQPLVRRSYQEPKLTYETNVIGTFNVLEAVRKCPDTKACVVVTTDKCYENKEWPYGYRENDPLGGYDPYSASKACAELVVASFRSSFLNPKAFGNTHTTALASVRAGNVIGGGDWSPDRLIPDFVKATVKGEVVTLRNPGATRPWQHVLEPLAGYLWLAASMCQDGVRFSEAWNFGPDDESVVTVETVVKHLLAGWGKGRYAISGDIQPHEAHLLKLDTSKARSGLGWKPLLNIQRALQAAGEWYRAYYDGRDMAGFTVGQIEAYVQAGRDQGLPWSLA